MGNEKFSVRILLIIIFFIVKKMLPHFLMIHMNYLKHIVEMKGIFLL